MLLNMHTNLNYNKNQNNNNNNNNSRSPAKHAFAQNDIYQRNERIKPHNSYWTQVQPVTRNTAAVGGGGGAAAAAPSLVPVATRDDYSTYFQRSSYQNAANDIPLSSNYCNRFFKTYGGRHSIDAGEPHDSYKAVTTSCAGVTKNYATSNNTYYRYQQQQQHQQQQLMSPPQQRKQQQQQILQQQLGKITNQKAEVQTHNLTIQPHVVQPTKMQRSPKSMPTTPVGGANAISYTQRHQTGGASTWNCILSPEREAPLTLSTDQHYQHYFSYFYNRSPENKPKPTKPRRLPMNIPTQLNSNAMHEVNVIAALKGHHAVSIQTSDFSHASPPNNHNHRHNKTHILKEKLPHNNNVANGFDNGEWLDDYDELDLQKAGDAFLDVRDVYKNESKSRHASDRHAAGAAAARAARQHNISPARISRDIDAVGDVNDDYDDDVVEDDNYDDDDEDAAAAASAGYKNNNSLANIPLKVRDQVATTKLPLTPRRLKTGNGAIQKKIVPSVHRVLLYNSQSPRMAHKSRTRSANNERSVGGGQQVIVLKSPDSKTTSDEKTSIAFDRDDDEFDDDDDLDNVSNFDESDVSSVGSDGEDGYRAYAYKLTHSNERITNSQTCLSTQSSEESLKCPDSLLVPSLFPNVPPYLSFSSNTQKGPDVPPDLHRVLKWRVTNIMPKVVRLILANSGMRLLKKKSNDTETNDWMGVWGKHLKSPCFKTIRAYQKINHLPGSFRIGRKDSCWKNLQKHMNKHSKREFGFMPRTYIIPNDLCVLRKHWPKYAQRSTKWIIKPPASARGAGIRVVNRWAQIPKRRPLIVQKYIERPLLINGSKFDLRLYVLVTSVNPLRVYMYHNGLARFASVKYSAKADTLNDRCMHLTNYSINKFSSNYSKNEDVNACHGHKWTIKSLWTYLANRGVRTDYLWEALRSLVLRTILAGENSINHMIKMNVESKYSVFELFGFDVILDADLVPWLLEVNISPSLHSELPLDAHVKAPLVQGVLNTALYNVPPKLTQEKQKELAAEFSLPPGSPFCYDKRLYINYLSREEKVKHNTFCRRSLDDRTDYLNSILTKLTPDDVRCLIISEDELARCAPLERIFPTDQTYKYLKYTDTPRYYNRLLDAWESRYAHNRAEGIALLRQHCKEKYHLQVPTPPAKKILKFRPRTLVVTRPTVLTPSTLRWKLKWTNPNHLTKICLQSKNVDNDKTTEEQQQQQQVNTNDADDEDDDDASSTFSSTSTETDSDADAEEVDNGIVAH